MCTRRSSVFRACRGQGYSTPSLHNFNVRIPERGGLGTGLIHLHISLHTYFSDPSASPTTTTTNYERVIRNSGLVLIVLLDNSTLTLASFWGHSRVASFPGHSRPASFPGHSRPAPFRGHSRPAPFQGHSRLAPFPETYVGNQIPS